MSMHPCDKCGLEVTPDNNAVRVVAVLEDNPIVVYEHQPRHFLPTEHCEGSPSRAQYIEGQPRDTRGHPYYPSMERKMRLAYAEVQQQVKKVV